MVHLLMHTHDNEVASYAHLVYTSMDSDVSHVHSPYQTPSLATADYTHNTVTQQQCSPVTLGQQTPFP